MVGSESLNAHGFYLVDGSSKDIESDLLDFKNGPLRRLSRETNEVEPRRDAI